MSLLNFLSGNSEQSPIGTYIIFGVIIVIIIFMYVSQNKQRKKQMAEDAERKSKLCEGTEVITIGGIMGTVVSVNHEENTFVLESEGSKIKFDKRSIYQMKLPAGAEEVVEAEAQSEVEAPAEKAE